MKTINQQSGIEFRVHIIKEDNSPTAPTAACWKLRNVTTDADVTDFADVTPVSVSDGYGLLLDVYVPINVPGSLNTVTSGKTSSTMSVIVVVDKDTDGEYSETYEYCVKELRGR